MDSIHLSPPSHKIPLCRSSKLDTRYELFMGQIEQRWQIKNSNKKCQLQDPSHAASSFTLGQFPFHSVLISSRTIIIPILLLVNFVVITIVVSESLKILEKNLVGNRWWYDYFASKFRNYFLRINNSISKFTNYLHDLHHNRNKLEYDYSNQILPFPFFMFLIHLNIEKNT